MKQPLVRRFLWALLVVLALIAASCGSDSSDTTSSTPEATQTSEPTATPEATAEPEPTQAPEPPSTPDPTAEPEPPSTPEATAEPEPTSPEESLDAINNAVAQWLEEARAPGVALAVAEGDNPPWSIAWGVRDLATGEPLVLNNYFRIGSITKTVTTSVVLQLVDEGLLDLDTPVSTYLGDDWAVGYEHAADITLRHLMGHTAGFVEYAFDPQFFALAAERLEEPITPAEIVQFSAEYPPVADFGTEYSYSTTGHVVAGLIIEAVTGNDAEAEIRSRILDPLGLENTYLTPGELPPESVVNGYNSGTLALAFDVLLDVPDEARHEFMGAEYIETLYFPQELLQSAGWTGGGLEAQISDVPLLFRGLFGGDLLSEDAIAEMTTPGVNPSYGLGVSVSDIAGYEALSHGGGVPGFRSMVAYFPELDISIALSTNLIPVNPDIGELMEALLPIVIGS